MVKTQIQLAQGMDFWITHGGVHTYETKEVCSWLSTWFNYSVFWEQLWSISGTVHSTNTGQGLFWRGSVDETTLAMEGKGTAV